VSCSSVMSQKSGGWLKSYYRRLPNTDCAMVRGLTSCRLTQNFLYNKPSWLQKTEPLNMSYNSADFIQNICVYRKHQQNGIRIKQPISWNLVSCKYSVYGYTFQLKWDKSYCVFLDMYVDTIIFKLYPSGIHHRMWSGSANKVTLFGWLVGILITQ